MNPDRDLDIFIRNGLADGPELRAGAVEEVARRLPAIPQRRGWLPSVTSGRSRTAFSAVRLVAAVMAVALFGGFLLISLPQERSDVTPSAPEDLVPMGAELMLPTTDVPLPFQDGLGDVWAYGGSLLRFGDEGEQLTQTGEWTWADDAAFLADSVAPGQNGGVWLAGTAIRHFDGKRFDTVLEDPPGFVIALAEGSDGSVWAVTEDDDGTDVLWRWDGTGWTNMRSGREIDVVVDDRGGVWVVSRLDDASTQVAHFDGSSWRDYGPEDHPGLDGEIEYLKVAPEGHVFALTSSAALLEFDGTGWSGSSDLPRGFETGLSIGPDGQPWITTSAALYARQEDGSYEAVVGPASGLRFRPEPIVSSDGVIVGTDRGIVHVGEDGEQTIIWAPSEAVTVVTYQPELLVASEDVLWVSYDGAVWRCHPSTSETSAGCTRQADWEQPPVDERRWMARSVDGTMWSVGDGGTARLEDGTWLTVDERPSWHAAADPDGSVWVLQEDEPLELVEWTRGPGGWTSRRHQVPGSAGHVHFVLPLPGEGIWVTGCGWMPNLAYFDGTTWTRVTSIEGRPIQGAWEGTVEAEGNVWVRILSGGSDWVARHDGTEWAAVEIPGGEWGLVAAPNGDVWVGGDGLHRFDGETWMSEGLEGAHVTPIAATADGSIWFTKDGGGLYRMPASTQ